MTVSILNYQMGNIRSVVRKLERLNVPVKVISSSDEVLEAEKLILPGVGHFGVAMSYLKKTGLINALNESVIDRKTPVLGICLGMQLMCAHSEEGDSEGLGWFEANVTRMQVEDSFRYKIPHIGWNKVEGKGEQSLLRGIESENEFYFVHAYHIKSAKEEEIMATTVYETPFVSGLKRGNIMGVQFHPEKSHLIGEQLIKNFLSL